VSHLIGFELLLRGEASDTSLDAMPDYVKNPVGEMNEAYVVERRSRDGQSVVDEFEAVAATSIERLHALSDEEWEVVGWSPEGEAPYHRFMETRLLDSWIHLQDIRDALALPEDDHGVGEEVVVNRFEAALPYVIGKRAALPDGALVRIHLSGRIARTISVAVVEGRARNVDVTEEEPGLEIVTPVALFWRRAAGRISAEAFLEAHATSISGNEEWASAISRSLAVMI
jgi:uncharacterized protein (TIGR03083 family)